VTHTKNSKSNLTINVAEPFSILQPAKRETPDSPHHQRVKSQFQSVPSSFRVPESAKSVLKSPFIYPGRDHRTDRQPKHHQKQKSSLGRNATRSSGSLGGIVSARRQMLTLELTLVNKLMTTKRETDQAFHSMRRQQQDHHPHLIQPTKHVSTATSGTASVSTDY